MPRHLPPPNLANTPRIEQLMHDGKLYISMNDAVALALENNLDIAISRYNLNIADTDIWRAKAGANILGVNSRRRAEHARRRRGRTRRDKLARATAAPRSRPGAPAPARRVWSYRLWAAARRSPASIRSSPARCRLISNNILSASPFALPDTVQNTTTADFSYKQGFSGARTSRWDSTTPAIPPIRRLPP